MKKLFVCIAFVVLAIISARPAVMAQTSPTTVDGLLGAAKNAAGVDWSGTFLRLCIPPAPVATGAGARGTPPGPPAKETWYAEPARVADNLYFLGTKIHSAWAIVGSDGIIVLEALFDYAAQDEIFGGLRKLGLDSKKVKYVILSHAHADHDGGTKLLQDEIPGVWPGIVTSCTEASPTEIFMPSVPTMSCLGFPP